MNAHAIHHLKPETCNLKPLLLLLGALLFALPASAATDMFIKLGSIKGEAQARGHEDEIDVLAWSWGSSCPADTTIGGGGGAGKATFKELSFTKYIDKATPKLYESCVQNTRHERGTLTLQRGGDAPLDYLVIHMTDVLVTSVSSSGSSGEDQPTEEVTLNFTQVEMIYTEQTPDGAAGEQVIFTWDLGTNSEG